MDPIKKFGSYSTQGEPNCQVLLGYGRSNGRWVRTWQQGIKERNCWLALHAGDYHLLPGTELVFEHGPEDFTTSLFEIWHWNSKGLVRLAETETVGASRTGLQSWIGVSDRLTESARTIVANVEYDTYSTAGSPTSRVELLQWDGHTLRARYQLPGRAVAIADVSGGGHAGILIQAGGNSYTLYEPLPRTDQSRERGAQRR